MPTLRDDITEARNRADTARQLLAQKLRLAQGWTRDDKIESIDGLDSLVSMADEVLPFIPAGAVRGGRVTDGATVRAGGPAPISPAPDSNLYRTEFTRQGDWIPNHEVSSVNDLMEPVFPHLPKGYDKSRPNMVVDGGKWQFNLRDVDWTGDNAGTTRREFDIDVSIGVRPGQYGSFKIWPHNEGGDNRVVAWDKEHAQEFQLNGLGTEESFFATFRLRLTDAPRGQEHDWFKLMVEPAITKTISKNDGFYIAGIHTTFILPYTYKSQYRVCHVHSIKKGKLNTVNLPSINRVEEEGQFLHFRDDKGEGVLLQKVKDTVGFWFERDHGTAHSYEIDFESDTDNGVLHVNADDLHLDGARFYVMRSETVEGWIAADFVKAVRIVS